MNTALKYMTVFAVGLMIAYVATYLALVRRHVSFGATPEGCVAFTSEGYRAGGEAAAHFYSPVHWIDRRLRTTYWSTFTDSDSDSGPPNYDPSGAP